MSSIFRRRGSFRYQTNIDGRRRSLSLGTTDQEIAEELRRRIDRLFEFVNSGLDPSPDLTTWLERISPSLRGRLADFGLCNSTTAVKELGDFFDVCRDQYPDCRPSTLRMYSQTYAAALRFFGKASRLDAISEVEADNFRRWLLTDGRAERGEGRKRNKGLSKATVSKRIKHLRQVFALAVGKKWIPSNPFAKTKLDDSVNSDRHFFVGRDVVDRLLDRLPTVDLRTCLALARYGGFRVPSEAVALRWADVDFDSREIRVPEVKTRRRVCPLFPELAKWLDEAYFARESSEFVCPVLRDQSESAFDRALRREIDRTPGITLWTDLCRNLRRSRATEVFDEFGAKAESEWIGHGFDVSMRSYQIVTDEKIERAKGRSVGAESSAN